MIASLGYGDEFGLEIVIGLGFFEETESCIALGIEGKILFVHLPGLIGKLRNHRAGAQKDWNDSPAASKASGTP